MKVYIVFSLCEYDNETEVYQDVFGTQEAAQAYVIELNEKHLEKPTAYYITEKLNDL